MRISEYQAFMEKALQLKRRILVTGPPGVGKTYAKEAAARHINWDYLGLCAPLEDPSSIRGYPHRVNGTAEHCLFDVIAKAFKTDRPTVLDFDDLGMASESTMRAIVRLFQFGQIDNRKLPDCVVLSASTNDVGHGAGVYGMIEPLKSRFHSIINVEANLDDTVAYGIAAGWPWQVCSFLRNKPDALHDWKPSKSMKVDGACPRGWEYAAGWINDGVTDTEVLAGCIGKGWAAELNAWCKLASSLPDINGIQMNPDTAPVPDNPSAQFMASAAIASRLDGQNFARFIRYLLRLPQSMRAYCLRDCQRALDLKKKDKVLPPDYRAYFDSPDWPAYACSADGKELMAI